MDVGVATSLAGTTVAVAKLAQAVEERGFASLYLPEHTHMPVRAGMPPSLVDGVRIEDYRETVDPLVALAAAASVTSRIRLGTGVLLVAQHDPIVLAKQLATLDRISGGRVTLGVGYGWNRAEAQDHGVDFAERRALAREKLLCMAALWGSDPAEFHGRLVDVPACWASPKPVQQPRIRTLIGGAANAAVFAAIAEHADGWMPIGGSGLAESLPRLRDAMAAAGRDPSSLHVVPYGTIPSPGKLDRLRELGATEVALRVPSGSEQEMLASLDRCARYLDSD